MARKSIAPHIYRSIADIDFDLDANGDLALSCSNQYVRFTLDQVLALHSFFETPNVLALLANADLKAQRKADRSFKISEKADRLLLEKLLLEK